MQWELQRENIGMPTTQQLGFTTFDGKLISGGFAERVSALEAPKRKRRKMSDLLG
jgi:hypothetical protein